MPVSALKAVSTARNGVGAFIPQCRRIELHYSNWGGSSRGMKDFLQSPLLSRFAAAHPHVQIHVSPRGNEHPLIVSSYINGKTTELCVKNLHKFQILNHLEYLSNTSGQKDRRVTGGKNVESLNEGVRGMWDELHAGTLAGQSNLQEKVERIGEGLLGRKKKGS